MEKACLKANLAQVEEHIHRGEMHIIRQREIVEETQRLGVDHSTSAALLETFELLLCQHRAHREILLRAIAS